MNYNRVSHNLDAIRTSDGQTIAANIKTPPSTYGVSLVNAVTYVFPFGASVLNNTVPNQTHVMTAQLRWDNAIAFTATIEESCFPATDPSDMATGVADVTDHDTTLGNWIPIKPPDADVQVTGGGTYTAATGVIAVAAGQQGGCTINLSLWGARRGRIKIVVGATGGLARCAVHGKAAA